MKKVVHGCPYCGSTKGFEQKETLIHYLAWDKNGEPDYGSDPYTDIDRSWKYPRCVSCGHKVIITEV